MGGGWTKHLERGGAEGGGEDVRIEGLKGDSAGR